MVRTVNTLSIISMLFIVSCYSFTGGNIPSHIKSLYIQPVVDKSGYGNPAYRDELMQGLIEEFRQDNSFDLAENPGADARLEVEISSISDSPVAVSQGDIESERKVTIRCKGIYYDNVKRKEVWNKTFSTYDTYELSNAQANRNEAISELLEQISNDILLAVVSGW